MSVGPGGRAPFKRTTGAIPPTTNNCTNAQSKPPSRPASIPGKKRDTVSSLFSSRRPPDRKVEQRPARIKPKSEGQLKGQQNQTQQQSTQQQQQQQASLRQAPSASSLEAKTESSPTGNWSSIGKEAPKGNAKGQHHPKGPAKGTRMQELEREIEILRKERARLEANLRDVTSDAQSAHELRAELASLKEQHSLELERLTEENEALRARLRDVAHSPLSDSEKQQLLLDASRLHNSAPASIAIPQDDSPISAPNMPQDNAQCTTPDWDKHSSSSVSEVSVACLQDRILQMEETHYSTNEELQATIQELSDLQAQLTELQADNERLTEEKGVLLESLCRQTEKLEDSRSKVDTLQGLLLREEQPQESSKGYNTEREQKLVDLLKSAQEERESLLQKQEELTSELKSLRATADASITEIERLTKCVHLLESTVDSLNIERKQLDIELAEAKQEGANRSIEISRLATLLENARAKIDELEQSRQVENKSEADELLDAARREKDTLETQAAALQEQLARSHCDHDRLRDQYSQLQEEYKVARNNAKSAIDDLEYRLNQLKDERLSVSTELQLVRDSLAELQAQCQRHLEDKRELKAALSEAQRREREAQAHEYELERSLSEERKLRQEESAEWQQFQTDLLMTVRVANDFKTEAQSELERVVMENKAQRDKLRILEAQLDKLNKGNTAVSCDTSDTIRGNVRKPASNILKRGRTIIKKRQEPRKILLQTNLLKTAKERNLQKIENSQTAFTNQAVSLSPMKIRNLKTTGEDTQKSKATITDLVPSKLSKPLKAIKVDHALTSDKEIEICGIFQSEDFESDVKINLNISKNDTDAYNDDRNQEDSEKMLEDTNVSETVNFSALNEDYPKLYISVPSDSVEENKAAKSSLLQNIKGIQKMEADSYGIEISNSRFFVPKNYIFSDVANSMDDLKFEVDPEMGKLLQRNSDEACSRNVGTNRKSEVTNNYKDLGKKTVSDNIPIEVLNTKVLPSSTSTRHWSVPTDKYGTAPKLNLPPQIILNDGCQRLFLKRKESRPSSEIVDTLLDSSTNKLLSKDLRFTIPLKNYSLSMENLNTNRNPNLQHASNTENTFDCPIYDSKYSKAQRSPEQRMSNTANHLVTARQVIINDYADKSCEPITNNLRLTEEQEFVSKETGKFVDGNNKHMKTISTMPSVSCSNNKKQNMNLATAERTDLKSFPVKNEKSYSFQTLSTSPEYYNSSACCFVTSTNPSDVATESTADDITTQKVTVSENKIENSNHLIYNQANHVKYAKVLEDNLESGSIRKELPKRKSSAKFEDNTKQSSKLIPEKVIGDYTPAYKDRCLIIGRTSSLREKFETIIEDVELRPGRRVQTSKNCDRKSPVVWSHDCLYRRVQFIVRVLVSPASGKNCTFFRVLDPYDDRPVYCHMRSLLFCVSLASCVPFFLDIHVVSITLYFSFSEKYSH